MGVNEWKFIKGTEDSLLLDKREELQAWGIDYYIVTTDTHYIIREVNG